MSKGEEFDEKVKSINPGAAAEAGDPNIPRNPDGSIMTEAQVIQRNKIMRKQAEQELLDYKKRLARSVELKKMQNEELKLNIEAYHLAVEWKNLQPKIEEFEAQEEAERKQREEERRKMMEKAQKPNIVGVTQGKARKKED
jgi:hypothetical protein